MKNILAIDPGTKAGIALIKGDEFTVDMWDVAHEKATKVLRDRSQKRKGEPKYFRLKNLWNKLELICKANDVNFIIFEGAAGFQRGKSAVESSHKYRAVIELYCALNDIECLEIPPNDLKFFALGKRSGDKFEMIQAAKDIGYEGSDDNEADAYLIAKWYVNTQNHINSMK